jgi:hypothetical protein
MAAQPTWDTVFALYAQNRHTKELGDAEACMAVVGVPAPRAGLIKMGKKPGAVAAAMGTST